MAQTLTAWIHLNSKNEKRASSVDGVELVVARLADAASDDDVNAAVLGRLGDLGVAAGETFMYFGRSPLGEPVYISVRDTVVALRLEEADLIYVASGVVST